MALFCPLRMWEFSESNIFLAMFSLVGSCGPVFGLRGTNRTRSQLSARGLPPLAEWFWEKKSPHQGKKPKWYNHCKRRLLNGPLTWTDKDCQQKLVAHLKYLKVSFWKKLDGPRQSNDGTFFYAHSARFCFSRRLRRRRKNVGGRSNNPVRSSFAFVSLTHNKEKKERRNRLDFRVMDALLDQKERGRRINLAKYTLKDNLTHSHTL